MKVIHILAFILTVVGALNWGIVGVSSIFGGDFNLVEMLLGSWPYAEDAVYVLVGLSAIVLLFTHSKTCTECTAKGAA